MRVDTVVQEGRRSPADSRGDRNLKSLGFSGAPFHKTYITNPAPALWSLESGLTLESCAAPLPHVGVIQ